MSGYRDEQDAPITSRRQTTATERHIGRLIDGQPSVVIQNMEGAGGLVGAKYIGEVAPRDGTLAGYLTATAFLYALDPERFRVDFKTYEFVGIQPGTFAAPA